MIELQKDVRFEPNHFATHGAGSLDFETVYYMLSQDHNRYMDIHQVIQLAIGTEFEHLGFEFAYPAQKLYLAGALVQAGESTEREMAG